MRDGPLFVYGNWASYDELSDSVPLDEALAMRQLDHLRRLRSHGVRFDAYLMDAFWFAPDGAYQTWRKPHWPDGPDRWLDACREHNLLPGLWFTANTLFHLDLPPKWADSIDHKNWGLCLFEGGFLADFMEVLDHWYQQGVRLFKFDFAEFNAVPAARQGLIEPEDARQRNIATYREALAGFRASHLEAVLMAYNGFEERECMDRSDHPPGEYFDLRWLEIFDSLYCGDPRPSDLPLPDFWKSVDIYSDCMTSLFESSGIPLDRIDNCGFMAGDTGTCYWRGKAGWRAMLVLSLARGGRIHVAYGDLGLFDDDDARSWAEIQNLYAPAMRARGTRSFGGWPRWIPPDQTYGPDGPYGWLSTAPNYKIATAVNPTLARAELALPTSARAWRLCSGGIDDCGSNPGPRITMEPGEVAVLVSGPEMARAVPWIDLENTEPRIGSQICEECDTDPVQLDIPSIEAPASFRVVLVQVDQYGAAVRTYPGEAARAPFQLRLYEGESFTDLPPMFDRKIWSGLSWWLVDFSLLPSDKPRWIEAASESPDFPILWARLQILK